MPGINDSQRLAFRGRYFYINSVINENEANHMLVLLCSEAQ